MTDEKFLVVLGLDSEKKPHAARFSFVDEKAVNKAAGTKGFKIGIAKTREAAEIAAKLIEGKIFDSGRGLVPFVTRETYDKLLTVLEIKEDAPSPPPPAAVATTGKPTDLRTAIKVGSIVLVHDPEPGPDRSWWECKVTEVSKDLKVLTVVWRQYPKLPPIRVKRSAVAMLPSKS
jgi:hypothetical protein